MTNVPRKVALLSSLGAGLEYYDFIIYGMMAEQLSTLFFASDVPWISLLKAFAVFAVGYLLRPFGGIAFGMIGDTFGRKKTFVTVMLLMAISTLCIGLLPTYAQIGGFASCLLIFFRILQGLSFGAELPGAITVVCEYAKKEKQGSYSGFVISSVSLGSTLASLVLYLLTYTLTKDQVLSWGWRIPFLLGGLLAVANYYIRSNLQETPEFENLQAKRLPPSLTEPFFKLLKNHKRDLFLGIGMTWFLASLVIFSLYSPTFLSKYYQYLVSDVYLAMTWGLIWSAISLPICGRIADHFGKVRVFIFACLAFAIGGIPLFGILQFGGFIPLVVFMTIYQTFLSFLSASFFPMLSNIFPTSVRYTGIAASYNITYSIMGCAPIVLTMLISSFQVPNIGIWFLITGSLIGAASCTLLHRSQKPSYDLQGSV